MLKNIRKQQKAFSNGKGMLAFKRKRGQSDSELNKRIIDGEENKFLMDLCRAQDKEIRNLNSKISGMKKTIDELESNANKRRLATMSHDFSGSTFRPRSSSFKKLPSLKKKKTRSLKKPKPIRDLERAFKRKKARSLIQLHQKTSKDCVTCLRSRCTMKVFCKEMEEGYRKLNQVVENSQHYAPKIIELHELKNAREVREKLAKQNDENQSLNIRNDIMFKTSIKYCKNPLQPLHVKRNGMVMSTKIDEVEIEFDVEKKNNKQEIFHYKEENKILKDRILELEGAISEFSIPLELKMSEIKCNYELL